MLAHGARHALEDLGQQPVAGREVEPDVPVSAAPEHRTVAERDAGVFEEELRAGRRAGASSRQSSQAR